MEESKIFEEDNFEVDEDEDEDYENDGEIIKKTIKKKEDSDDEEEEDQEDEDSDIEDIENIRNIDEYDNKKIDYINTANAAEEESEDSDEEDNDEDYLQTFEKDIHKKVIEEYHPELIATNYKEIEALCKIVRDENGIIVDPFHKTSTFITKYERARVIGERAKQLNAGAQSFIQIDPSIMDGYLIAMKEFEEKKIPFIIQRPLPNGGCEYWRLCDLEII